EGVAGGGGAPGDADGGAHGRVHAVGGGRGGAPGPAGHPGGGARHPALRRRPRRVLRDDGPGSEQEPPRGALRGRPVPPHRLGPAGGPSSAPGLPRRPDGRGLRHRCAAPLHAARVRRPRPHPRHRSMRTVGGPARYVPLQGRKGRRRPAGRRPRWRPPGWGGTACRAM
ncbi:MAG: hypothetical protein AVDCRST_MAG20-598, partial [uncultured Acidimicrobiales bacterium]